MKTLISLATAVSLSGCTVAFGGGAALSAVSSNSTSREHHRPETASVGTRALVGALIGLAVDVVIASIVIRDIPNEAIGRTGGR